MAYSSTFSCEGLELQAIEINFLLGSLVIAWRFATSEGRPGPNLESGFKPSGTHGTIHVESTADSVVREFTSVLLLGE